MKLLILEDSQPLLRSLAEQDAGLRVLELPHNQGKGAAVLHGLNAAAAAGFTHVLTMDSDGQHPAERIPAFMAESSHQPGAMILGVPVFESSAPRLRVQGRRVSNGWANLETLWAGIGDSLFGFRVYPIEPLRQVMRGQPWMRHFDFDPEAVEKVKANAAAKDLLAALADDFAALPDWSADAAKHQIGETAKAAGAKPGQLMFPVRVALSGKSGGPDLGDILGILGRESCVTRLRNFAHQLSK